MKTRLRRRVCTTTTELELMSTDLEVKSERYVSVCVRERYGCGEDSEKTLRLLLLLLWDSVFFS